MTLETDAFVIQLSCAPVQKQSDDTVQPTCYWSRPINDDKRRYDTAQKECLAIAWSVFVHRPYVEGTRFTIRSDHVSLK